MSSRISILLVDDDLQVLCSTAEWLGSYGYSVFKANSIETAINVLNEQSIDLAFVDLCLGSESGMDVLLLIKESFPQLPVVFLSGHASIEDAMTAVRHGAMDFLTKPLVDDKILEIISNQIKIKENPKRSFPASPFSSKNGQFPEYRQAHALKPETDRGIGTPESAGFLPPSASPESRYLHEEPQNFQISGTSETSETPGTSQTSLALSGIIGTDPAMNRVHEVVERIADTRTTVLITGESGTGKSMLARAIHRASLRANKPFVEVACGALPESLLESELFGHEIGAFTGAVAKKIGRFLQADGGTIFLDEIGTASTALQIKLLRVLQDFEFEPVGSTKTQKVDVRVILATNEDLTKAVAEGRFRQDLYYRINVINLEVPPLRRRAEDVPLLAQYFLEKTCRDSGRSVRGFAPETLERMKRCKWPGNVRELQNVVERAVLLGHSPWILPEDLPESICICDENHETLYKNRSGSGSGSENENLFGFRGSLVPEQNLPSCVYERPNRETHGVCETENLSPLKSSLSAPERRLILEALEAHQWSRTQTAEFLGINRTTLYKKMKKFQLRAPRS